MRYNISSLYSASASDKPLYELSEAYIQLYTTNIIEATGCAFPDATPTDVNNLAGGASLQNVGKLDNKNALSLKDPILLVNQFWVSMGGANIITSPTHSYLYNILKLRSQNEIDFKHKQSVLDRYMDNGSSMVIDADVGEINNISSEIIATQYYNLDACNDKIKLLNRKFVPYGDGTNKSLIEVSNFTEAKLAELEIPYFKFVSTTKIVYFDVVKIYLKDLDDFFKNMPSTQQISKFNITVNTNISDATSWTVTYGRGGPANASGYLTSALHSPLANITANATASQLTDAEAYAVNKSRGRFYFKPVSVTLSAGNATCCPFLLGDAGLSRNNMLNTAMVLLPDDYTPAVTGPPAVAAVYPTPSLKITSKIGWTTADAVVTKNQTYLFIPQVKFNPAVMPSIISNEPYEFFTKQATIDLNTFINIIPGQKGIKKPLNNQWSRVRNIYLIPYLTADGFTATVKPYESPVSSAPITNSFAYLNRIQIWQGGKPLLPAENNITPIDYYDNQLYRVNNPMGNNVLGPQSGMISKFDWRGGYHYYQFDMTQYSSDATADATPKSYEIGFDVDSKAVVANNKVDVVVIIELETNWKLNRFTGEFVV